MYASHVRALVVAVREYRDFQLTLITYLKWPDLMTSGGGGGGGGGGASTPKAPSMATGLYIYTH